MLELRKKGHSIKELARELKIAKSTVSLWVREIYLNENAQTRLKLNSRQNQLNFLKICKERVDNLNQIKDNIKTQAIADFRTIQQDVNSTKLTAAILFWAEGTKNVNSLRFTNSDPKMIGLFIKLMRGSFALNEIKWRVLLQLHEYHDEKSVKDFWSNITGIPLTQFCKSYLKPHTGKNLKQDYMGCACLYYYDYRVAHELTAIYNAYADKILGV